MQENSGLLYKIARAFDDSARCFRRENAALAALECGETIPQMAPFQPLRDGVWCAHEEGAGTSASLVAQGAGKGVQIDMHDIGSSRWFSLSWAIDRETLASGRYFGLLAHTLSDGLTAWRPCLRYLFDNGSFQDVFCREHMVCSGGAAEELGFIRIDPARARQARATEIHLFFTGARFRITFLSLENLLIA